MLIYGTDLERKATLHFPSRKMLPLVMTTMILSYFLWRKFRFRSNGLISSCISAMPCFWDVGRFNIKLRFEKYFFAKLFCLIFFGTAIFGQFLQHPQQIMTNNTNGIFDEITKMNPPIYLSPTMSKHEETIKAFLRFDFHRHLRFHFFTSK